jgi:hypothetical protein
MRDARNAPTASPAESWLDPHGCDTASDGLRSATDATRPRRATRPSVGAEHGARPLHARLGTLAGVLLAGVLGTAAVPSLPSANASVSSVKQTCVLVAAVLSDGPDPGVDPVGYAQAQILPLREIHTRDAELKRAIDSLASAYQIFVRDNGKSLAAHRAVNVAMKEIDAICPRASS